jgi:hypothetical protein
MDGGLIHELGTHMDTLIGIFMDRLMDWWMNAHIDALIDNAWTNGLLDWCIDGLMHG